MLEEDQEKINTVNTKPPDAMKENMYTGSVNATSNYSATNSASLKDFSKEFLRNIQGVAEYTDKGIYKYESEFWLTIRGYCMDSGLNPLILKGTSVYRIEFYNIGKSFTEEEINIFDQILSTFKFTN